MEEANRTIILLMKIQLIPMKNEWTCLRFVEEEKNSRVPVHLCCIIDTSGSMRDDMKMFHVKQSLQFFLDSLGGEDYLSIITFDVDVRTLVQRIICKDSEKVGLRQKIQLIDAYGGTNLCAGLMEARHALLPFDTGRKQGIMLLTDGEATHGHVQTHAILDRVESVFETFSGTSLSCIGYGTNHNVELLRRLSEKYAGSYYVVQRATDVPVVFGDIMGGLLSTRSQRIHVGMTGAEIKSSYPVCRTMYHRDVYVGDLPSGKEATILVKAPAGTPVSISYDPIGEPSTQCVLQIPLGSAYEITSEQKMCAELHSIRYEVIDLMRAVLDQTVTHLTAEKKVEYSGKINGYKQRIQTMKIMYETPLWELMLTELEHLYVYITEPARCCIDFQQVLIQRMGCLAMLRGVGASASNQYRSDVPDAVRLTPSISQGYSNALQQTYSMNYTQSFYEEEEIAAAASAPVLDSSLFAPGALLYSSSQPIDFQEEPQEEEEPQPGAI